MSGIEIAGLAIGVLPLLVELVKSYSAILRRAHTFRHYAKAIKSLSTQLDTQNGLFMNEIRLLLMCVEDETVVESMLADASNLRWTSEHELGRSLHLFLGNNLTICHNIIEEISEMIMYLRDELKQFDVFREHKSTVSTNHVARVLENRADHVAFGYKLMAFAERIYETSNPTLERSRRHHP
jgi:hypothetical protein